MASTVLSSEAFHPHGVYYLWRSPLMRLPIVSDALIFLTYLTIPVVLDKHQVLLFLVNFISHAKYAVVQMSGLCRVAIRLHLVVDREGFLRLQVSDTGVGIKPKYLTRVFSQGFTTRQGRHDFGLHSGALAAKVMGGSLSISSNGEGQGATFTLDLPAIPVEAHV